MAKCFHGLQYSRTAEDLITATNQIIDKLDQKNADTDIDIMRLRRIGIDVNDQRAEDSDPTFVIKDK